MFISRMSNVACLMGKVMSLLIFPTTALVASGAPMPDALAAKAIRYRIDESYCQASATQNQVVQQGNLVAFNKINARHNVHVNKAKTQFTVKKSGIFALIFNSTISTATPQTVQGAILVNNVSYSNLTGGSGPTGFPNSFFLVMNDSIYLKKGDIVSVEITSATGSLQITEASFDIFAINNRF